MTGGLPLKKNVLTPLTKNVLSPLGLTAATSATDAAIQKEIFGPGTTVFMGVAMNFLEGGLKSSKIAVEENFGLRNG